MSLRIAFLALVATLSWSVHAQQPAATPAPRDTVAHVLAGYISVSAKQCAKTAGQTSGPSEDNGREMLCVCAPDRARQLLATLPKAELAKLVTEADFQQLYMHRLFDACSAQTLRRQYEGEACARQPLPANVDRAAWCACMVDEVRKFPESDATQLGIDMSDYGDAVRAARANHTPDPEPSALVKRMVATAQACQTH